MGVAPAGVVKEFTGHHHLLVDTDMVPLDQPIPSDYNHIHLGNGQTETVLTLPAGTHTLQLLLGDHLHVPHKPPDVEEDHDLCALTERRFPENLRCLEGCRIWLPGQPGCRDAETASGRRCLTDVAIGDGHRLWPECAR